jgi:hypothetical protein
MTEKTQLRWEDAAIRATSAEGWVCVKCGLWYGDGPVGEHAARYCCSTDAPCECGGRHGKYRSVCDACLEKHLGERWASLPEVEWDGTTPLVEFDSDRYLWEADDLVEYLAEDEGGFEPTTEEFCRAALDGLRLCLCRPVNKPHFHLDDLFEDYNDDIGIEIDIDAEGKAAEKAVNDWIAKQRQTWTADSKRPSLKSLRKHLGIDVPQSGGKE